MTKQILDGAAISSKELNVAREAYLGKLTIELLGERIGHFSFKNITELDLRNCKIKEVDCLSKGDLKNLRKLNFDYNLLTNIDCFISLTGLRYLSLNNNRIERLLSTDPVSQSSSGSNLIYGQTPKIDMSSIARLTSFLPILEELYLGNNLINRISDLCLYRMKNLKVLYLHGNKIVKIEGFEHMTNVVELVLDKNQIKATEPASFVSLINLKHLSIRENRLKTLANFDCIPNLQRLFAGSNRIHELYDIEV